MIDIKYTMANSRRYKRCMSEIKLRLFKVTENLPAIKSLSPDSPELVFKLETAALHLRKVIELIAFGSIAANEVEYQSIRENYADDWNARLIFRDVERLNKQFYPVPIAGLDDPKFPGGPSTIVEHEAGFLDKTAAIKLYERLSAFLHAANPYGRQPDHLKLRNDLETQVSLIHTLLENFWVYLPAEKHAYCVWMYFGTPRKVDIALFSFDI